jgi:hypothetical protein
MGFVEQFLIVSLFEGRYYNCEKVLHGDLARWPALINYYWSHGAIRTTSTKEGYQSKGKEVPLQ